MKPRVSIPWWVGLVAFALGLLCGRWWTSETALTPIVARVTHPAAAAAAPAVVRQVAPAPSSNVPVVAQPGHLSERLKYIAELNTRLSQKLSASLLMGDALSPDFVTIFEVSPAERARINDALGVAKHRLAELEASHATITAKDNGGWSIAIPPFPEDGGRVYSDFEGVLRDTLGAERFAAYQQMVGPVGDHFMALGNFGLANTTLDIRPPGGDTGTSGQWSTNQSTGLDTVTANASVEYLRDLRPELYKKLVAQIGFAPAPPAKR